MGTGDVPRERREDKLLQRYGRAAVDLDYYVEQMFDEMVVVQDIKFKSPRGGEGDWLAIVSACVGDDAKVAFHSAETFAEVVGGLANRLRNGSLKWRDDEYRNCGR